ncbi:MAG: Rho termination factor N-terminal domain-containing protein, partial [Nocardioidaceae bacterium]
MAVLQRTELEQSPLADLHAIASEIGLEGFRRLRRDDLIGAILEAQGAEAPEAEVERPAEAAGVEEAAEAAAAEPAEGAGVDEAAEAAGVEEAAEVAAVEGAPEAAADEAAEADVEEATEAGMAEEADVDDDVTEAGTPEAPPEERPAPEREEPAEEQLVAGVLDVLPNGSGFLRLEPAGHSRGDVYVAPAQIRRCELRPGDEVAGPVRPPRRGERHPSLVRVAEVNGREPEPPEQRPRFDELTPVFATERLPAPATLEGVALGRGSRVTIAGPPGAGASSLLHELAAALVGGDGLALQVALVGARPEEVTEWLREPGVSVVGGSFDRSPDAQAQAVELAVERAKRQAERGGHAVVLVDSLAGLPP